jgi:hypothetical protein
MFLSLAVVCDLGVWTTQNKGKYCQNGKTGRGEDKQKRDPDPRWNSIIKI